MNMYNTAPSKNELRVNKSLLKEIISNAIRQTICEIADAGGTSLTQQLQQKLDSGIPPAKVFDVEYNANNGFIIVVGPNAKWNILTPQNKILSPYWFDYVDHFYDGVAAVTSDNKWGFINTEGKMISKVVFDWVYHFVNGFAEVELHHKKNFINTEGKHLSNTWFDNLGGFNNGLARVELNHKWNFINTDGELLSDAWVDKVGNFNDGIAPIRLKYKINFINTEGELLSDTWFNFSNIQYYGNHFGRVELNGKYIIFDVTDLLS